MQRLRDEVNHLSSINRKLQTDLELTHAADREKGRRLATLGARLQQQQADGAKVSVRRQRRPTMRRYLSGGNAGRQREGICQEATQADSEKVSVRRQCRPTAKRYLSGGNAGRQREGICQEATQADSEKVSVRRQCRPTARRYLSGGNAGRQ